MLERMMISIILNAIGVIYIISNIINIIIMVGIWVIIMHAMQGWPPILADAFEGRTWHHRIVQCHAR